MHHGRPRLQVRPPPPTTSLTSLPTSSSPLPLTIPVDYSQFFVAIPPSSLPILNQSCYSNPDPNHIPILMMKPAALPTPLPPPATRPRPRPPCSGSSSTVQRSSPTLSTRTPWTLEMQSMATVIRESQGGSIGVLTLWMGRTFHSW